MYCLLNMKKSQNQKILSTSSQPYNPSVALVGHSKAGMKWQISLPFRMSETWQRYPSRAETPRIGHYRAYPLERPPPSPLPKSYIWALNELFGQVVRLLTKQLFFILYPNSLRWHQLIWYYILLTSEYDIKTGTSDIAGAGSNANIWIIIRGVKGVTRKILLDNPGKDDFQQGG